MADVFEFEYANVPPPAARAPGKLNRNMIRLWWDGDVLKYDRRYISKDGTVSDTGIEHTFEETNANHVAKNIHWGCCGWSAGLHQINGLYETVATWLRDTGKERTQQLTGYALLAYLRARFAMSRDEALENMRQNGQDMSFLED